MNKQLSRQFVAVLALLCSSVGMAASVTVVPSTATPGVGDQFTLLVQGTGFPETAGATLGMTWNTSVVDVVSVALAPGSPFTGGVVAAAPWSPISILGPLVGTLPSGDFDSFLITFSAIGAGSADIVMVDDQIDLCWSDAVTFACVGSGSVPPSTVDYTQASVTVVAAAGPNAAVTDSVAPNNDLQIDFGNVEVLTPSTQTVTVTNSGTADLTLGTLALVDTLATQYALANDTCSGMVLTPLANCTVDVVFTPDTVASFPDSFDIPSDDADSPVIMVLAGTGAPAAAPNIEVTDSLAPNNDLQIPFGDVEQGNTVSQTITVTNSGTAPLVLGTVPATALVAPFSIGTNNCSGQTLAALSSCTVQVQFQPVALGAAATTVDIPSDDPDTATVTVNVDGNGVVASVANITVTDAVPPTDDHAVPFGSVEVGQSSTQTITVTNDGTVDLVIGTVGAVTVLQAPFDISTDNCSGQTLAAAATCTIVVRFQPTTATISASAFDIPSNDTNDPSVLVNVGGTGTAVPGPDIVVTDSVAPGTDLTVPFGDVTVGGSTTQTVTVTNSETATANLVLGTVGTANPLAAPYTIANDTCSAQTLSAGSACTFEVVYQPTAIGVLNDAVSIESNDPDMATVTVSVSGNGTDPDIVVTDSVSPSDDFEVPFGSTILGDTPARTVTVTNSGNVALDIGQVTALTAPFSITADTCSNQSIAAAATCTITVEYAPDVAQDDFDDFDIPSNDPDDPIVSVDFSGTGVVGGLRSSDGGSALDPATLLGLGLAGLAFKRRRRTGA